MGTDQYVSYSGTFSIDEDLGHIDAWIRRSSLGLRGTSLGVYEIEGDTLWIAFGGIGGLRPPASQLDPEAGPVFVGIRTKELPDVAPDAVGAKDDLSSPERGLNLGGIGKW